MKTPIEVALAARQDSLNAALLGEDDLGVIVRAHIHIEHEITEFIQARLATPEILKKLQLDYDKKVLLAVGLGLKREIQKPLSCIGSIRNDFAHNLREKLGSQEANNLYRTLTQEQKDSSKHSYAVAREKFPHMGRPKNISDLAPKDRIVLYLVTVWGNVAAAAEQAKELQKSYPQEAEERE